MLEARSCLTVIENFLNDVSKKVLLIVSEIGSDLGFSIKELVSGDIKHIFYIDNPEQAATKDMLSHIPLDKKILLIFNCLRLENLYIKYDLERWAAKVIIVCKRALLHPTMDSSIYFAPFKDGRIQKHAYTEVRIAHSKSAPPSSISIFTKLQRNEVSHQKDLQYHYLNKRLMTKDIVMMQMLAERVQENKNFKTFLFSLIYASRNDPGMQIAAANAITALNYAGVSFSQMDLRRIQIRGANLSYAILDSADLREADLRDIRLKSAWLNRAKLDGALMQNVEFDELAYLDCKNKVWSIAYSSKGTYLATGHENGNIQLWLFDKRSLIESFNCGTSAVVSIAFAKNEKLLAAAVSQDICLWDIESKKLLRTLKGHTEDVKCIVFSHDNTMIASVSEDKTIRLWEANSYKALGVLTTSASFICDIYCVDFSPDDTILAAGCASRGEGDTIHLWEISNQKFLGTIEGHTDSVMSLAFSPNGKILAAGYYYKGVQLWEVENRKLLGVMKGHKKPVYSVKFSFDGKLLASGSMDYTVRLWEVEGQKLLKVLEGHTDDVKGVAFSPDSKILASGSMDKTIRLWETVNHKLSASEVLTRVHINRIINIAISPDLKTIASGGWDKTVYLWDVQNRTLKGLIKWQNKYDVSITNIKFSQDGKYLISGGNANTIQLWDVEKQALLKEIEGHTYYVDCVEFHPNGKIFASGSSDRSIKLWDWISKKSVGSMEGHTDAILAVAFSPNKNIIASGSRDETVRLWNTGNCKSLGILEGHKKWIDSVSFSSDDRFLASAGGDKGIRLWDVENQKLVRVLEGHTASISKVTFGDNDRLLISGSTDNTIRLWDIYTGECLSSVSLIYPLDLVFKNTGENFSLWVATDGAIYHFHIKSIQSKLTFVLLGSIGSDTGLMSDKLSLNNVVDLSQKNTQLLIQRGAIDYFQNEDTEEMGLKTMSRL